jgi:hypothetical protein
MSIQYECTGSGTQVLEQRSAGTKCMYNRTVLHAGAKTRIHYAGNSANSTELDVILVMRFFIWSIRKTVLKAHPENSHTSDDVSFQFSTYLFVDQCMSGKTILISHSSLFTRSQNTIRYVLRHHVSRSSHEQ